MKNTNVIKYFSFGRLKYYQDYDRFTEKLLLNLVSIQPEIMPIIKLIKNSNITNHEKIGLLCSQFKIVFYLYYDQDELSYFAERIGQYLFEGTEEYRYRKQFSE